ncbi:L-aspartate oxidase [Hyphomicrobium sp.]|uniref:L-aspartate oxidase n=1 Tax=Hyphomicrobium sp. TaxID=82 RepID=UPI002E3384ED|nr:L-aspartate oxidase [Hyphomicrobium sp.]HEX2842030.1 L-aspartate oxidase [Hyphomicrobium sp.]
MDFDLTGSPPRGFADPSGALGPGDIVVVGAGLAGLFTALRLAPLPVTVVAAAPLGEGASSVWAQGGIAAAVGEGDTPAQHAADTIAAGGGIVDAHVAEVVAAEAPSRIADLLRYGVPFDRDLAGHFVLSREAAHSRKRVVRVSGDRAGAAIMQALIAAARATPSIRLLEGYEAMDLILDAGSGSAARVSGVRLVRTESKRTGAFDFLPASAVVLATGGASALYSVTTNPIYARGEAIAFAARAGATIADAEFVQFHPTAIDAHVDPAPLASEALRGEGATLINGYGFRFLTGLDPKAELAPRDIVARGVFAELAAGRGAYLDCRTAIGNAFPEKFPTVYGHCLAAGIDPITQPIPIAPAAHYHMGGVATDLSGRTTLEGLWAVGEVASTGLHGANRLASNSLLEAVVLGARAADDIRKLVSLGDVHPVAKTYRVATERLLDEPRRARLVALLRQTMSEHVGVVRDGPGLQQALVTLREIGEEAHDDALVSNMALAAEIIAGSALLRTESRGAHFRADYPDPAPKFAHRSAVTLSTIRALNRAKARVSAPRVIEELPL